MIAFDKDRQPDVPLYVSVAEACRITSLSKSSLYGLMAEGKVAYTKVGKRRLVVRVSLEKLALGG